MAASGLVGRIAAMSVKRIPAAAEIITVWAGRAASFSKTAKVTLAGVVIITTAGFLLTTSSELLTRRKPAS